MKHYLKKEEDCLTTYVFYDFETLVKIQFDKWSINFETIDSDDAEWHLLDSLKKDFKYINREDFEHKFRRIVVGFNQLSKTI